MTLALPTPPNKARLNAGEITALVILGAAVLSALLMPVLPWVAVWPKAWTFPVNDWISDGLGGVLEVLKPGARAFAGALGSLLSGVNWVLTAAPWVAVFGIFTGLGLWVGGRSMALLTAGVLIFILASGYWVESMSTLSLVAVSVPLALVIGLAIGVVAFEIKPIKRAVEVVLDVMQTVPTFAYLVPLLVLFGFGPVVGVIASAIYAAPPMARNVLLGLERIEPEIREAAKMAGATRLQRLWLVELPAAMQQILVGVNQCVMAALSMVIIAAVIGAFEDIGWEVLLTMRKAWFGQSLLAGMVIVVFAILIDRMSASLAQDRRGDARLSLTIALGAVGAGAVLALSGLLPAASDLGIMKPVTEVIDAGLTNFTVANGAALDGVKNGAMFYVFLPLRIGLDDAVLTFTWGFDWTGTMSIVLLAGTGALALLLVWRGRIVAGMALMTAVAVVHTGVTNLPWPAVIIGIAAIGWRAGGWRLALFITLALSAILLAGLWERAMLSIYLCGAAVIFCAVVGGGLGLLAAISPAVWRVLRPICDTLQTIPLFVFLIPFLMFFQIGEFTAFLAICAYAIVPMIRYTRHGVISTPAEMMESAIASGATKRQILWDVRIPYAAPSVLLGLNQTILYAFAMLVIAALVGTTGLGQSIYLGLNQADIGLGIASGAAMALLALVADRLVQAFATERRKALGL